MATNRPIRCGLQNLQSVRNKTVAIRELINDRSLDIFVICETWLKMNEKANKSTISEMLPNTHKFFHVPRPKEYTDGRAYGGVGIFLSKAFTQIKQHTGAFGNFEYLNIDFNHKQEKIKFIVIYRPPSGVVKDFLDDLQLLMDSLVGETRKIYICGDFNLHVDAPDNNTRRFLELMDNGNFTNHVNKPTIRTSGHTLDLVFSDKDLCNVKNVEVDPDPTYVHQLVTFDLDLMINRKIKKKISFRNKADLQPDMLISRALEIFEARKSEDCTCVSNGTKKAACCNCLAECYNQTLRGLYVEMCPVVEKEIVVKESEPWFNTTIKLARKKRRWLEREWRKKRTADSRLNYTRSKNEVNRLIRKTKEEFFRSRARESKGDMKKLSALFNNLLGKTNEVVLPAYSPDLAQKFANYFEEKIDNIYNSFDVLGRWDVLLPDFPFRKFTHFSPICWDNYHGLVQKAKKSHCEKDPLPIGDMMKADTIDDLLRIQLDIINNSLENGVFPDTEKMALIKPTLKDKLDPQDLKSYRPVSNLTFLSKMIEAAALQQLNDYLDKIKILPESQSAYRKGHSTETTLCSVVDDLLRSTAEGKRSILILLDLSAAFDTVVHELLIEDLKNIGIDGLALEWFRSYLNGRSFQVSARETKSDDKSLDKGVPQGSVLGPILFCIYILELAWILFKHGISYHFYADDTQFYFTIANAADTQQKVDEIMSDITNWMSKKRLKLNEKKTECLIIRKPDTPAIPNDLSEIKINNVPVPLVGHARNLGVLIEENLSMDKQISSVVKAANFQLRNIALIKKYLDQDCLKMLVNSLVTSRVDYCNSLYYGLDNKQLKRLQNVLNSGARLITGSPMRDRITPVLIDLHWLPIKSRIVYKICVLTHLALKTSEPGYLEKKLHKYVLHNTQTRQSSDPHRLNQPTSNSKLEDRSFTHCAPKWYNWLPSHIKDSDNIVTFKKNLKTHLFRESYDLQDKIIRSPFDLRRPEVVFQ